MAGKFLSINFFTALCWYFLLAVSTAGADNNGPISILLSDNKEITYRQPMESFIATSPRTVNVFNLGGDLEKAPDIMKKVMDTGPSLIFALGAKAAYTAKIWTEGNHTPPIIFAMVINWQKLGLQNQANIAGISYNVLPGTQLIGLTIFTPNIKNVGTILSKDQSKEFLNRTRENAKMLGLNLIEAQIDRPEDFRRVYKRLASKIEALWILPDPVTYTIDNITWVKDRCIRDNLVCLGHSKNIATNNILFAVTPDLSNVGSQAANMAVDILNGTVTPKDIGIVEPIGTKFIVNMHTAAQLGIKPSQAALNLSTEIIE